MVAELVRGGGRVGGLKMLGVGAGEFSLFSMAATYSGEGTGLFVIKWVTDAEKKSSMRYGDGEDEQT